MFLVAGHFEHSLTKIGYFYKQIAFLSLLGAFFIVLFGKHYFYLNLFERMFFVLVLSAFFAGYVYFFADSTRKEIVCFFQYFKSRIIARTKLP
jgi:hypothetical protein